MENIKKIPPEAIVDSINECLSENAPFLGRLIIRMVITSNHQEIIDALAKKAEIFKDYCEIVNSVIIQKPFDYRLKMNSAKNLQEALTFGFDFLPLNEKFVGPQGKIAFLRNRVVKGTRDVAEISVKLANEDDNRVLMVAGWGQNESTFHRKEYSPDEIASLSDQW